MEEVENQKYIICIGHGHLQHDGAAWDLEWEENIRFHMYITSSDQAPNPDYILIRYEWSMKARNGRRELSTGLEECFLRDEGREDYVKEQVSG